MIGKNFSDKFSNDIYFNPKERERLRNLVVKTQEDLLKSLEKPLPLNAPYQLARERYWADIFIDQMSKIIDLIDNVVPGNLKKWELFNANFKLFKKTGGKSLVIKCNYKKGIPQKSYEAYMLIPHGLPQKGKHRGVQIIRDNYELSGYEEIDSGKFKQKLIRFTKVSQTFKGKLKTIKIILTQRGKIKDNNWLTVV